MSPCSLTASRQQPPTHPSTWAIQSNEALDKLWNMELTFWKSCKYQLEVQTFLDRSQTLERGKKTFIGRNYWRFLVITVWTCFVFHSTFCSLMKSSFLDLRHISWEIFALIFNFKLIDDDLFALLDRFRFLSDHFNFLFHFIWFIFIFTSTLKERTRTNNLLWIKRE